MKPPGLTSIRLGGLALIGGAVAFLAVFAILAARFNYPEVLDGPADTVLPALLATGSFGRTVWALYGLLPLIWIPAGVGAYRALGRWHPGAMLLGLQFAVVSAVTMMLGLLRWPSIHWRLAEGYAAADQGQRLAIVAMFDGLNGYLGNFLGEFVGELAFSAFFVLSGWVLARSATVPRWLGAAGVATGVLGWVGMFRNVAPIVAPIAEVNNYLLPAWMIAFGVVLLRHREVGPASDRGR